MCHISHPVHYMFATYFLQHVFTFFNYFFLFVFKSNHFNLFVYRVWCMQSLFTPSCETFICFSLVCAQSLALSEFVLWLTWKCCSITWILPCSGHFFKAKSANWKTISTICPQKRRLETFEKETFNPQFILFSPTLSATTPFLFTASPNRPVTWKPFIILVVSFNNSHSFTIKTHQTPCN